MAFIITRADLKTHMYEEIRQEITRQDEGIAEEAIATAIATAKGYLSRFSLAALFGTATVDATVPDAALKSAVKDLAIWHLVRLACPNIDMQLAQAQYDYAISWLKDIQKGAAVPEGWPYKETTGLPDPPNGTRVSWGSNPKRTNHL